MVIIMHFSVLRGYCKFRNSRHSGVKSGTRSAGDPFAEGRLKEAGAIQKDLQLHNVNIASYYIDKYALWLDFQTIDDNRLHGSGRW